MKRRAPGLEQMLLAGSLVDGGAVWPRPLSGGISFV